MDLDARLEKIAHLMEERLDLRGNGFEAKLAKAGRLLPRKLRREGALLVEAQSLAQHPKLGRRIDERRLKKALRVFERYLKRVDAETRRANAWIYWLAGNALSFFIIIVLVLVVLAWRGLV